MLRVARRTRPVQRMWALQKVGSDGIPEKHGPSTCFYPVDSPQKKSYLFAAIQDEN